MNDLENRISILEQELDVLKNQIQATLLEIQEQVLTNTYPELRSQAISQEKTPPPIQSISLNQEQKADPPTKSSIIRMVNLNSEAPVEPPAAPKAEDKPAFQEFDKYEGWLIKKVEQLGPERASKLVKVYAKQGHMPVPVAKHLLAVLSLYEEEVAKNDGRQDRNLILRLITGLSSTGERKHG